MWTVDPRGERLCAVHRAKGRVIHGKPQCLTALCKLPPHPSGVSKSVSVRCCTYRLGLQLLQLLQLLLLPYCYWRACIPRGRLSLLRPRVFLLPYPLSLDRYADTIHGADGGHQP